MPSFDIGKSGQKQLTTLHPREIKLKKLAACLSKPIPIFSGVEMKDFENHIALFPKI